MRLWEDPRVQLSLAMAENRGAFLFQIRPDIFPHGYLTNEEIELWEKYYANKPKT